MKKERFLSALSLTLLLTSLSAVAEVQRAADPMAEVAAVGWIRPDANGNLQPDALLSRAELAGILVRAFRLDQRQSTLTTVPQFQDVPASYPAYADIQTVVRTGIMEGYRGGLFFPEQRITRAEAFSIIAQAYGVFQFPEETINQILSVYPDAAKIPTWARRSMATALHEGLVNLDADRTINPLAPMTRADVAASLAIYLRRQNASTDLP
ncbi:MAG: S-layer homology domain-containing protein [Elainella sp.]